jgi:hypothetical protein
MDTLLRQVKGVGRSPLAYVLTPGGSATIQQQSRGRPYLGLVPKQEDSGIVNPS